MRLTLPRRFFLLRGRLGGWHDEVGLFLPQRGNVADLGVVPDSGAYWGLCVGKAVVWGLQYAPLPLEE